MMVDNGTDRAEHELWKYIDVNNPLHKEEDVKKYGNPLFEYYRYVDRKLGEILHIIDENTTLFLMSDHGQCSLKKFANLNMFLLNNEYMVVKNNLLHKTRYFLFKRGFAPKNIYMILSRATHNASNIPWKKRS